MKPWTSNITVGGQPLQQCPVSQFSVRLHELLFMVRNQAADCFMSFFCCCCCEWGEKVRGVGALPGGVKDGAAGLSSWDCSLGHIQPG